MSDKSWGRDVWVFLHTIVSKLRSEHFDDHHKTIIDYIFKICSVLPCPECTKHSMEFLQTVHFKNVKSCEDIIEIIYVFHNQVNKNTHKKEFPVESLSVYKNMDMNRVFVSFSNTYNKRVPPLLMGQSSRRRKLTNELKEYLEKNKEIYDYK